MIDVDVKGYLPYVFGASKSLFMIRAWEFRNDLCGSCSIVNQIRFYDKKQRENTLGEVKKI